ncbi:hypothetical protein HJC23_008219 [Cyclotella cryptica]|uniref:Uncharacterized protein n=1 Tax=Cyclotella cryptica TaxID=29204 RepID=A0ABD3NLV2_9STRA
MTKPQQRLNTKGLALIEEWPQHIASTTNQEMSRPKQAKVSFSEYSTKRVYITDPSYEDRKSYSTADQKSFRKGAAHEAYQINHLISSCPAQPGLAIRQLIGRGLLVQEELLGIEHLVSTNAKRGFQQRRSYITFVLYIQKRMREENQNEVNAEELAAVAIAKSSRMIEKARLRAALAL